VKHGVILSVANLYANDVGNPALPAKLKQSTRGLSRTRSKRSPILVGLLAILLFALAVLAVVFAPAILRQTRSREEKSAASPATAMVVPPKSIAVLPFENLSSDKENAYFADGVQDEILTDLAMIADLKVISRTSVLQYKNAAARNLREIGKQLGVAICSKEVCSA
jgi:hypothetical protein